MWANRRAKIAAVAILCAAMVYALLTRGVLQHRKDLALVSAIQAGDDAAAMRAVISGANPNVKLPEMTASDFNFRPSFPGSHSTKMAIKGQDSGWAEYRHEIHDLLSRLFHRSSDASTQPSSPALLVVYERAMPGGPAGENLPAPSATLVTELVNRGAYVNARDSSGVPVIGYAAHFDQPQLVQSLIAHGAHVGARMNGLTPLMVATARDAEVLLRSGADPNERDAEGETALHWATLRSDFLDVKTLVEAGANRSIRDNDGHTPYDLAKDLPSGPKRSQILRALRGR